MSRPSVPRPSALAAKAERPETGFSAAAIIAALEEDIVFGRLHPRERLVEQELVDRFGSNRPAVRQALFELDKKGLVERIPNRGAMVRDLTPDDVRQIYAVREELEVMAARIIPLPVGDAEMRELEAIQARHTRAAKAGDLREVFYSNLDFHRAVFALCDNPHLIEAIEHFAQKAYSIRSYSNVVPAYLQRVKQDHEEMLRLLRTGDRKNLIAMFRRHLQPSKETYVTLYKQRFPYMQVVR
jgi:DNA-binding GntR family transcriptional regulator